MNTRALAVERKPRIGSAIAIAALFLAALVSPMGHPSAHALQAESSLEIVSPSDGETITANEVEVTVDVENYTVDCNRAGMPDEAGLGHIHVMIDGMTMAQLTNFYCNETFTVPLHGLEPGTHTLIVDLATNTHLDMMETAKQVEINYQPENPVELPEPSSEGVPSLALVSPEDGTTVSPVFTVEVEPINFTVAEEFEGKQNVPGHGHWHVFVDTADPMALMQQAMAELQHDMSATPASGEMAHMAMPMPAMVLMPGTNTFELDLTAWGPGEHTIFIEPAQNDHTHLEEFEPLIFTVVVEENATPAP
jgi:azurin